jgi:hypothetical protein
MLAVLACSAPKEVVKATKEEIAQAINTDSWRFSANVATSQYGNTRYLTSDYDVKLINKSLEVHLPYFGRAYNAPVGNQSPLQFKSTKFTYNKTADREGSWVITIKPEDFSEVQSMTFTFFESGNAQLSVLLTNRSPISFTGFVGAAK